MITKARGVHAAQLAEWTMFGLLAVTKDLPRLMADKSTRRWHHYPVRELRGCTLLIIGLGGIGREVARLARGLGMRTIGVRHHAAAGERDDDVDELHATAELPELVGRADAVVLCLPGTPATEGLFNRALLEMLPSHAAVVNVGRGTTMDETPRYRYTKTSGSWSSSSVTSAVTSTVFHCTTWSIPRPFTESAR